MRLIKRLDGGLDSKSEAAWRVVWWRGCQFPETLGHPEVNTVLERNLVDELWACQKERRQIRVRCSHREYIHND